MSDKRSIFSQLESEHDDVKKLLEKAVEAETSDRSALLEKIKKELIPHARGEEKTIYAVLRNLKTSDKLSDLVHEAYAEHKAVDMLLTKLEKTDVSDDMWKAQMAVLKENIEHHIKEEENDFFPKARKYMSREMSADLLEVYLREKERFSESLPSQSQISAAQPSSELRS